jgi:hypothetical protein
VEPGLYVTFFTEGEPFDKELPPVGPLEHVVVRDRSLLADRKDGQEHDLFGGGGRWVEAEHELRRATGKEPGGAKRPDLRIAAPEGVYLRFVSFGEAAEHDLVPELGPYAVVVIGRQGVEADGDPLAKRAGATRNLWELTGVGGSAYLGVIRPDVAFRTRSTTYHPEIKPFRLRSFAQPAPSQPVAAPSRPPVPSSRPIVAAPAVQPKPTRSTRPPEDPGLTLRDRIGSERPSYVVAPAQEDSREWGGAAWRLRFLIIGALVLLLAVFSVPSVRSLLTGTPSTSVTVGVGTAIAAPGWTYNVGAVRRVPTIGAAKARGTYVVVQVAVTNRGAAGAKLNAGNFSLATADGEEYAPAPTTGGVYSAENPDSPFTWPKDFPVGRAVVVPLVFDVTPTATGLQLVILDVPTTRVRLE